MQGFNVAMQREGMGTECKHKAGSTCSHADRLVAQSHLTYIIATSGINFQAVIQSLPYQTQTVGKGLPDLPVSTKWRGE